MDTKDDSFDSGGGGGGGGHGKVKAGGGGGFFKVTQLGYGGGGRDNKPRPLFIPTTLSGTQPSTQLASIREELIASDAQLQWLERGQSFSSENTLHTSNTLNSSNTFNTFGVDVSSLANSSDLETKSGGDGADEMEFKSSSGNSSHGSGVTVTLIGL